MNLLSLLRSVGLSLAMLLACSVIFAAEPVALNEDAGQADPLAAGTTDPTDSEALDVAAPSRATPYDWAATGYVAWASGDQLGDMLFFQAELSNNKIWVAALTRRILTFYKDVDWEVEGQIGKQGGGDSGMRNWEFNALSSLRWNRFIWDKYVDTSLAAGLGLSYATEEPAFEIEEHGSTNKLLAYILVELAFTPPKYPRWAAVIRIHHRSSAYGTFEDDIQGASNSLGAGIKYRF
jgi:hypothetical protein